MSCNAIAPFRRGTGKKGEKRGSSLGIILETNASSLRSRGCETAGQSGRGKKRENYPEEGKKRRGGGEGKCSLILSPRSNTAGNSDRISQRRGEKNEKKDHEDHAWIPFTHFPNRSYLLHGDDH